jgi:hypothetical protein
MPVAAGRSIHVPRWLSRIGPAARSAKRLGRWLAAMPQVTLIGQESRRGPYGQVYGNNCARELTGALGIWNDPRGAAGRPDPRQHRSDVDL